MGQTECLDFAGNKINPKALGFSTDEPDCQKCMKETPDYATQCMEITEQRGKVEKEKIVLIDSGKSHKFVKGTARGDVFECLEQGVSDADIIVKLEARGLTRKNAVRKLWAVKKIRGK